MELQEVIGVAVLRGRVKRRGGKLLEAELELDSSCRIVRAVISGDFFAYPPTAVDDIEQGLRGCKSAVCIRGVVHEAAQRSTFLGVTPSDIEELLVSLWRRCAGSKGST
ncbi:MAG: ABC transporter substrate-binding protein [Thermoprotei archaeon]|nr:MAG: ABC transporter substrate-binding protein [Thermoprotei archaeon]